MNWNKIRIDHGNYISDERLRNVRASILVTYETLHGRRYPIKTKGDITWKVKRNCAQKALGFVRCYPLPDHKLAPAALLIVRGGCQ